MSVLNMTLDGYDKDEVRNLANNTRQKHLGRFIQVGHDRQSFSRHLRVIERRLAMTGTQTMLIANPEDYIPAGGRWLITLYGTILFPTWYVTCEM